MAEPPELSRADWLIDYPPPRSLLLDQEALRIYEHAYYVGLQTEGTGNPPVSFTTVMIALLAGEDETSRWFALQAIDNGPIAEHVYSEKNITKEILEGISRPAGKPASVELSTDKQLLTVSARAVIENAEQWAHRVGGSDIGVRHLLASYLLNPPAAHRRQILRWEVQEGKWRSPFFAWCAERYTAEQWTDASYRPAPTKAVPAFEQQKIKGDALAFPGDASTMAILEKAATYHARRKDPWLRLQTVFYALVETARNDDAVREAILPIWNAVKPQYQQAHDEFFGGQVSSEATASFSGLDLSPRVLNALETARELAVATRRDANGEFRVGALHLAGALVSRRVDVDGDEGFTTIGLKPQELRVDLINHAQEKGESGEVWREALGEEESLQTGRPVDLNSDEPEAVVRLDEAWTSDPLLIRSDVEAFAALLASQKLEPPLSIGLFGPWGSGKTTFLKRLRRAVERRAVEARTAIETRQPTAYVSNVVHVDFNAWHFAEDALTSSLVDTILRALNSYMTDEKQNVGKAWSEEKLKLLESSQRKLAAATALEQAAVASVTLAEGALVETRKKAAAQTTSFLGVVHSVWKATKDSFQNESNVKASGVLEAVGETISSTDELRARLNAARTRPGRILMDLGWRRSILFAVLVLALPPFIGWLVGKVLATGQAGQLFSSVAAMLSVIAMWARAATAAVSKVDNVITQVADAYASQLAQNPHLAEAQAKLDAAQASAATAAAGLQAAREELARARVEAANATLPAQMLNIVSSRLEDQSYNKELTTLSLARADLDKLSRILREQVNTPVPSNNNEPQSGDVRPASTARAVDRMILYIDDLDRCKPADVVRVLQMVHMLLAFELFVVVVAVDARWVEEALIQSYNWLAGDDRRPADESAADNAGRPLRGASHVTPQDYLEKIFQISFWLEPMTSARAASYLGSLVPAPARKSGSGGLGSGVTVANSNIAGIELDYMRALAAYVGPSPRRVKRLVNAYRLIKARMSDAQLNTFLTDRGTDDGGLRSGPYQIVIGLLVIGTGAPSSSAQILKELAEWDPRDSLDTVVEQFRGRSHPDWTMAAQVIEMLMGTQKAKDVSELRGWARKVGRFLLNGPAADIRFGGTQRPAAKSEAQAGG